MFLIISSTKTELKEKLEKKDLTLCRDRVDVHIIDLKNMVQFSPFFNQWNKIQETKS